MAFSQQDVPIKLYLFPNSDDGSCVDLQQRTQIRRFRISSTRCSFADFLAVCQRLCGHADGFESSVAEFKYRDEDRELVSCDSEEEWQEALRVYTNVLLPRVSATSFCFQVTHSKPLGSYNSLSSLSISVSRHSHS